MIEVFDIVTANGLNTGRVAKRGDALGPGEFHVVVMGLLTNKDGQVLISKRSEWKTAPGKWECTAGSVLAGESSRDGMLREIKEELGIEVVLAGDSPLSLFIEGDAIFHVWHAPITHTLDDLVLQEEEVAEARYVHTDELEHLIRTNQATRSLSEIVKLLKNKDR